MTIIETTFLYLNYTSSKRRIIIISNPLFTIFLFTKQIKMENTNIFHYPRRKQKALFIFLFKRWDNDEWNNYRQVLGDVVASNDLSAVSVSNLPYNRLISGNNLAARLFQRRHIGALTDSVNFTHRLTESVY